jgi:phytoene synthase
MITEKSKFDSNSSEYVENIVRQAGSSFYWSMRRLPKNKRHAMYAIYAFCREVDDLVDNTGEVEKKLSGLSKWRKEIECLYEDRPRIAVSRALINPVKEFNLQQEDFFAVIDGMEMDARESVRISDMEELVLYCDRVASAVGRLSVQVFGLDEKTGKDLAFAQGQALQLTNILRDIYEDTKCNRLYIPHDLLETYGIKDEALDAIIIHPVFEEVCKNLSKIAENYFCRTDEIVATCDAKLIRPAVMMMEIYRQILIKLKQRGWQKLSHPADLSKLHKFLIACRYGIF